jgi:hypothetical protein
MVRRTSTLRRRGLTAYKVHELLMGRIKYPLRGYDGYGDMLLDQGRDSFTENYITDAMRQDWEGNRDALMAFWRSGKSAHADDLAEFGLNIRMLPWLLVCGSRNTLPWAAKQFDTDDGLARPTRGGGAATGGRGRQSRADAKGARPVAGD